jgi:hypothetical protein
MTSILVKRLHAFRLAAVALACAAAPAAALGQSRVEVLERVAAQAREETREVENYTVQLSMLEGDVTVYVARRSPSEPFLVQFGAQGRLGPSMSLLATTDAILLAQRDPRVTSGRRNLHVYRGVTDVTGAPAHVVKATTPGGGGRASRTITAHYDTATLLPRRLELGEADDGTPARITMDYSDYRTVDGLRIPFKRRVTMRGNRAAMDTTRARTLVNGMRAGMAQQSPAERERAAQIVAQLEGVLDRDEMVYDVTVASVRVNQGPPSGVRLERLETLQP